MNQNENSNVLAAFAGNVQLVEFFKDNYVFSKSSNVKGQIGFVNVDISKQLNKQMTR